MTALKITEGEVNFAVPTAGKPVKTWYKVYGDLTSGRRPLVLLHGGPGIPHSYLLTIAHLTASSGNPTIFYDQIGCGKSTHLREKRDDASFWTEELFLDELNNLLSQLGVHNGYDLLGHSWGAMMGALHASRHPTGMRKLILADGLADMKTWERESERLKAGLPQEVQDAIEKHEREGTTDSEEYQKATEIFYAKHLCRINPPPALMQESMMALKDDDTVYSTMIGPSEFNIVGTLKNWNITDELHKIEVPTLLINGKYDEATDALQEPLYNNIPDVRWEKFEESAHMPHLEETAKYLRVISEFLQDN